MNVQKIFGMEVLSEEEAWFLFREGAGTCVDNTKLNSIAKEVMKECKGLPIALTVVGAALKDEKDAGIWKDALRQLRQCNLDIPDFIAEVYHPLKLSYDFLESKHAQSLFLLCCLFPEDADISLEMLTCFCMGLGIFEGIGNLEEARNRVRALIKMLKSRSLLLNGRNEDYVLIHDVVRDVCTFIAKQEKYIDGEECTWISTCQRPTGLGFPNARLLFLIRSYNSAEEEFKLDGTFLEGMRDLYVLCIQGYRSLTSMPRATQSLTNLTTLFLNSCDKLNSISVVGELVKLEVLICRNCTLIEELPQEMKGLNRLKILELTSCDNLQRIGRGIISSLVGLEELKMRYSFKKWEAEDSEERENVGLRELEALTNLRWLEIDIQNPALAVEKMHLSSKIDRFIIILGTRLNYSHWKTKKVLHLRLEVEICLGHWIEKQLLRDTEYLYLCGNGANNVRLRESQNLRWLKLSGCETMKNIDNGTVFPSIEYLILESLPMLQEIWEGPISSTSFNNLETLNLRDLASLEQLWKSSSQNSNYVHPLFTNLSSIAIERCPRLRNLGQLSILPQLEELKIKECEMMEQVFLWNGEDVKENNSESRNSHMIKKVFAKLKFLQLVSLPSLTTFYQGIGGIEFPLLEKLKIEGCPKMKYINLGGTSSSAAAIDDDFAHLFCQPQKVSFTSNLKKLKVDRNPFCGHKIPLSLFNGLKHLTWTRIYGSMGLFTSSVARNLVSLEVLSIVSCNEMVKVVEDEEEVSGCQRAPLFPKLQELHLKWLSKLVSFCEWKHVVEFPSLRIVEVLRCPNMENFTMGFISAPNLEYVIIDHKIIGDAKDLNGALQQAYMARAKENQAEEDESGKEIQEIKEREQK